MNPTLEAAAASSTAADDRVYHKVFWHIMPFLMLCYVVAYLDRVNVGFAKLQMNVDLGFSETVFGLGAGLFFIGYFIFEVPSNVIMYRIGAKIWIARIMITWGLVSAAFIFVKSPPAFYAMRFLLGLAEAGFFPGIILYLTYWYPAHRRAAIITTFMAAIPVSGIFGNPLSGWIIDAFGGTAGLRGWQWMFVIQAVPAIVLGIATIFYLDNGIRSAKWLNESEKTLLEGEIVRDVALREESKNIGALLRDPRIWAMCLIYFSVVLGQYGLTFWMPTLVKATGVKGNLNIGLLSAIPFVCAVIAMPLLGRSADARRERRWHLIVPALLGAVGFVVSASFPQNTVIAITFLSLAAAGVLSCAPLFWSLPTAFLTGAAAAGGIAIINSVGNLSGFASPYLVGYLKDATHSNQSGMFVLAGFLVVGAVATYLTPAKLVNR